MKSLMMALALVLGSTAGAHQYRCAETATKAFKENRPQYAVWLTYVREIKDKKIVGEYDKAEVYKVTLLARNPRLGGAFKAFKSFETIAKSEDVMFNIQDRNGFKFHMFMDELDQSSLTVPGTRKSVGVNCSYKE